MPSRKIHSFAAAKDKGRPQRQHRDHRSTRGRDNGYRYKKGTKEIVSTKLKKYIRQEEKDVV